MLIALWIGDFFSMRRVGKSSAYVSELLKKNARGLQIALEESANLTTDLQKLVTKKVRAIHRLYWLANKTLAMIGILALQQWLVMTAKQNWGLVVIEVTMLVICGAILAADFRVNIIRVQLEKALKPYEDRLWFEYKLRS
jgi:carbon starvation protein CstA